VSAERFISFQFCDDIRQEVGNKFSLIGCYGTEILVSTIPAALPKLCSAIKIYTPVSRPFTKLTLRLLRGDSVVAELTFPPESLAVLPPLVEGARWLTIVGALVMAPFPVEEPCTLRVEAETEEGVIHGGSIWIKAANLDMTPSAQVTVTQGQ